MRATIYVFFSFCKAIWKGNYKNLEFALKIDGYELVSPKNRKESEKKLIDFIREHNNDVSCVDLRS